MMDFLDRIGRPLTRMAVMVLMLAVTWVFVRLGNAFVNAMDIALDRWARGEPVDWAGIAAPLGGLAALLGVVLPFIISLYRDRRMERVEQIRVGGSVAPPFPSPAPSAPSSPTSPPDPSFPGGGLVNNQAIE
jgi:hypothetical protein